MTQAPELSSLTIEAANPIGDTARELIYAPCSEMSARYGAPSSPFSPLETGAPHEELIEERPDPGSATGTKQMAYLGKK